MGFFSDRCPECGGSVRRSAAFCPHCGTSAPRARTACPGCGAEVKANSTFCVKCGAPVQAAEKSPVTVDPLNRWERSSDEFARRIEAQDLRGLLRRGLVVEPGTRALIIQGGVIAGVVGEGAYDLNQPLGDVDMATPATAILLDAGDTPVLLSYRGLSSREDLPVEVSLEIVVRLVDGVALATNLMHGSERLMNADLADLLQSQTVNVVQARIKQTPGTDLDGNLTVKQAIEDDLRKHIGLSLARNGLELVEVRFVAFSTPALDAVRKRRAESFVLEQKADHLEQRKALIQRIRETLNRDRMAQFTSSKDLEQFIRQTEHELGMKEVIRQVEMDDLKRTFDEKHQDAEIARRHLLETLELEHRLAVLRKQQTLTDAQFEHKVRLERETLRARQEADWETFQLQLRKRDAAREDSWKETQARAEAVRLKMGLAGEAIELRNKKAEQEHLEESHRLQREQEARDREAKRELEKVHALSQVEQARLAADLKKTEALKEMSVDQILALMAKDSPHLASALAERARAQAQAGAATSAELKAVYEKILAGKESETNRLERIMDRAMHSVERVAAGAAGTERARKDEIKEVVSRDMDRMADVAVTRAGAPGSPGAQSALVVCPGCLKQVAAGTRFCDKCGHKFFE